MTDLNWGDARMVPRDISDGVIRHNRTNHQGFLDFLGQVTENADRADAVARADRTGRALSVWDARLPDRWRSADLGTMRHPCGALASRLIEARGWSSFFIHGEGQVGKTYLAHAIVRRYVERGDVHPSQVRIVSEANMLSAARAGYLGQDEFRRLLHPRYRLYVFDNVHRHGGYTHQEEALWARMVDHLHTNELAMVCTSPSPARAFVGCLPSVGAKLESLLRGGVIHMRQGVEVEDRDG